VSLTRCPATGPRVSEAVQVAPDAIDRIPRAPMQRQCPAPPTSQRTVAWSRRSAWHGWRGWLRQSVANFHVSPKGCGPPENSNRRYALLRTDNGCGRPMRFPERGCGASRSDMLCAKRRFSSSSTTKPLSPPPLPPARVSRATPATPWPALRSARRRRRTRRRALAAGRL